MSAFDVLFQACCVPLADQPVFFGSAYCDPASQHLPRIKKRLPSDKTAVLFLEDYMTRREKKIQRQLKGRKIQNPKAVLAIYWLLRLFVVVTMVIELFQADYQNVFVCFLTLILFMLPSLVERHLHIDLPDTL